MTKEQYERAVQINNRLDELGSLKKEIADTKNTRLWYAYKQGYNDAIDKFCKFMQSCEGYVVSGNKCNYDNFIKYMEE